MIRRLLLPCFLLFLSAAALADDRYARRALLPADRHFTIYFSDAPGFVKAMETSPLGKLWNERQLQDFLGDVSLADKLKERLLGVKPQRDDGPPLTDAEKVKRLEWKQMSSIEGELALALKSEDKELQVYALYHSTKERFMDNLAIDRQKCELGGGKDRVSSEQFQGFTVYRVTDSAEGRVHENWQAYADGTGIESSNRQWLEKTLTAIAGKQAKEPEGLPKLELSFSASLLAKRFAEPPAPAGKQPSAAKLNKAQKLDALAKSLALDYLKDLSVTVTPTPELFAVDVAANGLPPDLSGVWSFFNREPVSTKFQFPHVPADTYSYAVGRFDAKLFWSKLQTTLVGVNPAYGLGLGTLTGMLSMNLGLDLNSGLLDNLGNLVMSYEVYQDDAPQSLGAVSLNNHAAMEQSLAKVFPNAKKLMPDALVNEKFLGTDLYYLDTKKVLEKNPESPIDTDYDPGVAVSKPYLLFGSTALIRETLQAGAAGAKGGPAFYDSDFYRSLARQVPDDALMFAMTDFHEYFDILSETLKSPEFRKDWNELIEKDGAIPGLPSGLVPIEWMKGLDLQKAPPPELLLKHVHYSLCHARLEKDRAVFALRIYPAPPQ